MPDNKNATKIIKARKNTGHCFFTTFETGKQTVRQTRERNRFNYVFFPVNHDI